MAVVTYVAPNFRTTGAGTAVLADMVAAKGGAPASTDYAYVDTAAVQKIDGDCAMMQFVLGVTPAGDPGAGNRVGHLTFDPITAGASITITFGGAASNLNSGIKCAPAATGAETKGCNVTFLTSATRTVTFTNSVGAYNANNLYGIYMTWGNFVTWDYITMKYSTPNGGTSIYFPPSSAYTNSATHTFGHMTFLPGANGGAALYGWRPGSGSTVSVNMDLGDVTWNASQASGQNQFIAFLDIMQTGYTVKIRSNHLIPAAAQTAVVVPLYPGFVANTTWYSTYLKFSETDIRPTAVVPAAFALTNPDTNGDLRFTISNIASYANADILAVYDNGTGLLVAACTKLQYVADGFGKIVVPNGVAFTGYVKATSDGTNFSAASGTDTKTPTAGTAPTFAGIVSLTDMGNGTLQAAWAAAVGANHYEIHVHTASMSGANLNARTYVVGCVDDSGAGTYTFRFGTTAQGAAVLAAGTIYYVSVRAVHDVAGPDANAVNLSRMVTDPNASGGPFYVPVEPEPVLLNNAAPTLIYVVPVGKRSFLKTLRLCNVSAGIRAVTITKQKGGGGLATLLSAHSLAAGGAVGHYLDDKDSCSFMEAGTAIYGQASVDAASVWATLGVLEETI